ncbi:MAG TPA: hypothetical protein PLH11_04245 [Gemmobacter sp.]|nr:hypothetical protein [Gemmobacter sp.]
MKAERLSAPTTAQPGDLVMRPVLGLVGDAPLLAGVDPAAILDLAHVPPAPGLIAVCRDMPDRVVVLGYAGAAQVQLGAAQLVPDSDGWLVIGTGKAQIRLHPDGRIRLKAEDVTLDSAGRLGLRGAWIDLN